MTAYQPPASYPTRRIWIAAINDRPILPVVSALAGDIEEARRQLAGKLSRNSGQYAAWLAGGQQAMVRSLYGVPHEETQEH